MPITYEGDDDQRIYKAIGRLSENEKEELGQVMRAHQDMKEQSEGALQIAEECWQKCRLGDNLSTGKLSDREETCVKNCVGQFIELTETILASNIPDEEGEEDEGGN